MNTNSYYTLMVLVYIFKLIERDRQRMLLKRRKQNNRGFTLTELAVVLGVIGLILGAIWVAASSVSQNNATNLALQELQVVSQGVISVMDGRSFQVSPASVLQSMIASNVIPANFVIPPAVAGNPSTATNPWSTAGGGPNGSSLDIYASTSRSFQVNFYDVPSYGCLNMLLQAVACAAGQSSCPTSVGSQANPGALTPDAVKGWSILTPSAILNKGICTQTSGTNTVSVTYTF
jgi:prepilin-type N-terminal cleavage/methylation domain-containing protein